MASKPEPITCGTDTCNPLTLPFDPKYVSPCCTKDQACGLDSSPLEKFNFMFTEVCQATNQPGDQDDSCPPSPPLMIPSGSTTIMAPGFPGCCRAETHQCGYLMNKLANLVELNPALGCVDSTPFLEGGAPTPCGAGGAGN